VTALYIQLLLHILEYKLIKSPWRKCWQTNRGWDGQTHTRRSCRRDLPNRLPMPRNSPCAGDPATSAHGMLPPCFRQYSRLM